MPREQELKDQTQRVRLLTSEDAPEGFVYIPAGPYRHGSTDRRDAVYKAFDPGVKNIPGFLMSRREVTIREYLEFLNDPTVGAALQKENKETPSERRVVGQLNDRSALRADWQSEQLALFLPPPNERIYFVPYASRIPTIVFAEGQWRINRDRGSTPEPEYPVFGVSMIAAVEYAAWRSQQPTANGRRFRYRLPTDLEWEKAARGVDARSYVWGNHLIFSFCHSAYGDFFKELRGKHTFGGTHPIDESVYGVQDLGGSVSEPTTSRPNAALKMWVYRGGYLDATDVADYHCASRNRAFPQNLYRELGIRLVAELP
jgi:serine/threonine-protein kinase